MTEVWAGTSSLDESRTCVEVADRRHSQSLNQSQDHEMTRVRCVTEMGMGVDVHGCDDTKAARRAVSDALRHSSVHRFALNRQDTR